MNRQEIIENAKYLHNFLCDISEKITSEHPDIETSVDVVRHFVRKKDSDDYIYVSFLVSKNEMKDYIFNKHIGMSSYTDKYDVEAFVKKVNDLVNNL